jgi:hypothetical protein
MRFVLNIFAPCIARTPCADCVEYGSQFEACSPLDYWKGEDVVYKRVAANES